MGSARDILNRLLKPAGWELARLPRQVIPPDLPDAEAYSGPEHHARMFRPWQAASFRRRLTPEVTANTMLSHQKLYFLSRMLEQTLGVPGDVFEAGAGSGGSGRLMLDLLRERKSTKRLWLLDTFAGYQRVDADRDGSHMRVHDCRCAGVDDVRALLANDTNDVRLVPGLIPGTLAEVDAPALSFAHIDVNLYEPTRAALEFVLDRLQPGGAVVFDDYNWPATMGARRAIDDVCAARGRSVISLPESTQAFLLQH
jgi:SAM-dependent methyltransferase